MTWSSHLSIFKRLPLRGFLTVGLAGLLSIFLAQGGTALAAPTMSATTSAQNPTVVVARDVTSQGDCTLGQRTFRGATLISSSQITCPSGTVVRVFKVTKAEALARGENFVSVPQKILSSVQVQSQFQQQVEALVADARSAAKQFAPAQKIQPYDVIGCGMSRTLYVSWAPGWDTQNSFISQANYDKAYTICPSIEINWSAIKVYNYHSPGYWSEDKYAGSTWSRSCQLINNNLVNMGDVKTAGYDFLQVVSQGSHCFWWDTTSSIDLGTMG